MTIVRWRRPCGTGDLVTWRNDMNRMFEDSFKDWFGAQPLTRWAPAVDIVEKETEYIITAELPGIDQKDVEVEAHEGVLTIRGEKKTEHEKNADCWHCVERAYGSFERSFTLPGTVKAEDIKAAFNNGVLEVKLPKTEEAKPKKITVDIN
jgi:HSP20 family protein